MELFHPKSVVDVGCGIGNFLKVFKQHGVDKILGLDGNWVDRSLLRKNIPEEYFTNIDLEKEFTSFTQSIASKFDIAISVEVAEHLHPQYAENFVQGLCRLSDTVIFSAAVPMQGGENHINEQWPTYWIEHFAKNGFDCYDMIRPAIWNNDKIYWWYRQNILCFIRRNSNSIIPSVPVRNIYNIIHPDFYRNRSAILEDINDGKISFGYLLLLARKALAAKFKK